MRKLIFLLVFMLIFSPIPVKADPNSGVIEGFIDFIGSVITVLFPPEHCETTVITLAEKKAWNFEASEDDVILQVIHGLNPGTSVNETYYYGSRSIKIDFAYTREGFTNTYHFTITNETGTYYYNYSQPFQIFATKKNFVVTMGYLLDEGASISIYVDLSVSNKPGTGYVDDYFRMFPVYKVIGTSTDYIDLTIETIPYWGYQQAMEEAEDFLGTPFHYLAELREVWNVGSALFYNLFWILKTLFVDNHYLIIMFFESFALIYSMQARSIMGWWRRMIRFHKGIIEFTLDFLSKLIQIITSVVQAVVKIIKPFG